MAHNEYCACGATLAWQAQGSDARRAEAAVAAWRALHRGPGHWVCDRRTAQNARRRARRKEAADA